MSKDSIIYEGLEKLIAQEEQNVEALYRELGKAYFDLHSEDAEGAFESAILGIKNSKEKIAECAQQIKELKGLVSCPVCGSDVSKDMVFCTSCGNRMIAEAEPVAEPIVESIPEVVTEPAVEPVVAPVPIVEGVKCTACGANVPEGSKFCVTCGTRVDIPSFVAEPVIEPVSDVVTPTASEPVTVYEPLMTMPKCTNCGSDIPEGSRFCVVCGARVEAEPSYTANTVYEAPVPQKFFCIVCGKELEEGTKFCVFCGNKQY